MNDIELEASQHLGRLLFVFGRLETNIGLALINSYPVDKFTSVADQYGAATFDKKLTQLHRRVDLQADRESGEFEAWNAWIARAHALRKWRNRFAHGRWGFNHVTQTVAHACGLPGSSNQEETRLTLPQFAALIQEAEQVATEFSRIQSWLSTLFFR